MKIARPSLVRRATWAKLKQDLPKICPRKGEWIYRGESAKEARFKKDPAIDLVTTFDKRWRDIALPMRRRPTERRLHESFVLREFKRVAHHYYEKGLPVKNDFLEWFALGRHFGMPSRLLDFSYSFWVATYFACFDKTENDCGLVVAINGQQFGSLIEDAIKDPRFIRESGEVVRELASYETRDFHNPDMFWHYALKQPVEGDDRIPVVMVNPGRMNERLIAQQGLFLCQANIELTFMGAFEKLLGLVKDPENFLKVIVIPKAWRPQVIPDLQTTNIKGGVLFPDLQGFSQSLVSAFYRGSKYSQRMMAELEVAISQNPRW